MPNSCHALAVFQNCFSTLPTSNGAQLMQRRCQLQEKNIWKVYLIISPFLQIECRGNARIFFVCSYLVKWVESMPIERGIVKKA
jgi:hypothetical protein